VKKKERIINVSADFVADFVGYFYWALHLGDTIHTPSVDNERKMKREKKNAK
jgi:hypothetical protein